MRYMSRDGNCLVDGCPDPIQSRGFCRKHYRRMLKNEDARILYGRPENELRMAEKRLWIRHCKKQIIKAKKAYSLSCSLSARLFWRKKIDNMTEELRLAEAGKTISV